jgi:hypothetical protein
MWTLWTPKPLNARRAAKIAALTAVLWITPTLLAGLLALAEH